MNLSSLTPEIVHSFFHTKPRSFSKQIEFEGKKVTKKFYSFLKEAPTSSESFGFQWERYKEIQIDRLNGHTLSRDHLIKLFGKPLKSLEGKTVLEIGSGAGRYTDILRHYAKTVITVEPSQALFHNAGAGAENVIPVQADLFHIPVKAERIDIVFCRGVLQHTRDPLLAMRVLLEYVKPGGIIVFDIYAQVWFTKFRTYYYLRPITKRLPKEGFAKFLEKVIPPLLFFKVHFVNPLFPERYRYIREIPNILIPICDYTRYLKGLSWDDYVEWCILDTFDQYTPENDMPQTFEKVVSIFDTANAKILQGTKDDFMFVVQRKF